MSDISELSRKPKEITHNSIKKLSAGQLEELLGELEKSANTWTVLADNDALNDTQQKLLLDLAKTYNDKITFVKNILEYQKTGEIDHFFDNINDLKKESDKFSLFSGYQSPSKNKNKRKKKSEKICKSNCIKTLCSNCIRGNCSKQKKESYVDKKNVAHIPHNVYVYFNEKGWRRTVFCSYCAKKICNQCSDLPWIEKKKGKMSVYHVSKYTNVMSRDVGHYKDRVSKANKVNKANKANKTNKAKIKKKLDKKKTKTKKKAKNISRKKSRNETKPVEYGKSFFY